VGEALIVTISHMSNRGNPHMHCGFGILQPFFSCIFLAHKLKRNFMSSFH